MSERLPVTSTSPHYEFRITLDGAEYGFEFRWNGVEEAWFFSLKDSNGLPLKSGVRVVSDWPLALRGVHTNCPPGLLLCEDTTGARTPPGRNDLGSRHLLIYYPVSV